MGTPQNTVLRPIWDNATQGCSRNWWYLAIARALKLICSILDRDRRARLKLAELFTDYPAKARTSLHAMAIAAMKWIGGIERGLQAISILIPILDRFLHWSIRRIWPFPKLIELISMLDLRPQATIRTCRTCSTIIDIACRSWSRTPQFLKTLGYEM